jgi:hypothetical protein
MGRKDTDTGCCRMEQLRAPQAPSPSRLSFGRSADHATYIDTLAAPNRTIYPRLFLAQKQEEQKPKL